MFLSSDDFVSCACDPAFYGRIAFSTRVSTVFYVVLLEEWDIVYANGKEGWDTEEAVGTGEERSGIAEGDAG